eukprot:757875-Hanusia_phi.AAC.2
MSSDARSNNASFTEQVRGGASIPIASAEALRMLQRQYGATVATSSKKSKKTDKKVRWSDLESLERSVFVTNFARVLLLSPLLVAGPWLSKLASRFVNAHGATNMEATFTNEFREEMTSMYRSSNFSHSLLFLLVGGCLSMLIKYFFAEPCIRLGAGVMEALLATQRSDECVHHDHSDEESS